MQSDSPMPLDLHTMGISLRSHPNGKGRSPSGPAFNRSARASRDLLLARSFLEEAAQVDIRGKTILSSDRSRRRPATGCASRTGQHPKAVPEPGHFLRSEIGIGGRVASPPSGCEGDLHPQNCQSCTAYKRVASRARRGGGSLWKNPFRGAFFALCRGQKLLCSHLCISPSNPPGGRCAFCR